MIKITEYKNTSLQEILSRKTPLADVSESVSGIIEGVKKGGDRALAEYCEFFDRVSISGFEVGADEIKAAYDNEDDEFKAILNEAADNIRAYHSMQLRKGFCFDRDGITLGQKIIPIKRVGLYVPGGTAAYPSTVLMDSIPAKLAGVSQLVMVTPPSKDGSVPSAILAAAYVAGIDRVFRVGGAQAIAALAYGTESIPAVDKIVGPGNKFVAEAKRQVSGIVGIDMIAGPSEILIIADGTCPAKYAAADLLSQAEHDRAASAVLITDSAELAYNVAKELEVQLSSLPRCEIARESIESNGKIIVTASLDEAMEISNALAPEHLELAVGDPSALLEKVENAGSVFMGLYSPEPLGDYFAGPNHTLPTSGTARFSSALSVDDFVKKTQYILCTRDRLLKDARKIEYFAKKEGLDAHGRSVIARLDD